MDKKTSIKMFVKHIRENYYFRKDGSSSRNLWKYDDENHTTLKIWCEKDNFCVSGLDFIGNLARFYNLCCYADFSIRDNRLYIRIF